MTLVPGNSMWEEKPQEKKQIGQQQEDKGLLSLALARNELFCPLGWKKEGCTGRAETVMER